MSVNNNRQLDAWGIYRDPEHVYDALKIILSSKEKITEPLKLYKNCASRFIVDGEEIGRYMSTVVYSQEADIVLFLSSAEKSKYFEYREEKGLIDDKYKDNGMYTVEVLATPEVIEAFFERYHIPYQVIDFEEEQSKVNDNAVPETWFARERAILEDALRESHGKGCDECVLYPKLESELSIGHYLENGTFEEIWGSKYKGLIETDNNWIFLTDEGFEMNLDFQGVIDTINFLKDENGEKIDFKYEIDESGKPKELTRILVRSKQGECPADTFMNYIRLCIEKQKEYTEENKEIPEIYLIPDTVYLSDESVRYFMNSKLVDLIGVSKDGKELQFYWKDSEEFPALSIKLKLDDDKEQYILESIKEGAKGTYEGFEWNRTDKDESIIQIFRTEDKKNGIGVDKGERD